MPRTMVWTRQMMAQAIWRVCLTSQRCRRAPIRRVPILRWTLRVRPSLAKIKSSLQRSLERQTFNSLSKVHNLTIRLWYCRVIRIRWKCSSNSKPVWLTANGVSWLIRKPWASSQLTILPVNFLSRSSRFEDRPSRSKTSSSRSLDKPCVAVPSTLTNKIHNPTTFRSIRTSLSTRTGKRSSSRICAWCWKRKKNQEQRPVRSSFVSKVSIRVWWRWHSVLPCKQTSARLTAPKRRYSTKTCPLQSFQVKTRREGISRPRYVEIAL